MLGEKESLAARLKKAINKVIFPPAALTVVIAVLGLGSVAAVLALGVREPTLRYGSYLLSAYALIISVAAVVRFLKKHPPTGRLRSTRFGQKYFNDLHFRNTVSLAFSLAVNLAYIAIKLVSGIIYRSTWFISLAVFYALLAAMRIRLIRPANGLAEGFRRYRSCGILLLLTNAALAGIVGFMVAEGRHFNYPGYLIYAMAAYSFYAVITAAVNIFKARRHQSPILSAAKAVDLAAALVSILSLTTAMLDRFGENDDPLFKEIMTASVGGGVCLAVIIMAIYMILHANAELKKLHNEDN